MGEIRVSDIMDETIKSKESIYKTSDQIKMMKATFHNKGGSKTARNPGNGGNIFVFNNQEPQANGVDSSIQDQTDTNINQ